MKISWKIAAIYTAALIGVFILIFYLINSGLANRWTLKYRELDGRFDAVNDDYNEYKKKTEKDRVVIIQERDEDRKKSRDKILSLEDEKIKLEESVASEKEKIKELTADQLTERLNEYVPNEFSLLEINTFSLTRRGGERTLEIFMDGEKFEDLYEKQLVITEEEKTSHMKDIGYYELEIMMIDSGWAKCDNSLNACIESKEALEKAFKHAKWKNMGKGALGGSLFTITILKIFGVI